MAIPYVSWARVFNAIAASDTGQPLMEVSDQGTLKGIERAEKIHLEVVAATSPSWTMDIQGKVHPSGTYTNIDYFQTAQGGQSALSNAQLSITDTTRRFYVIPNPPPFVQLVATRTAGTLTVFASYSTATPFPGVTTVQGTAASDAAEAGNPIQIAGSVDDTSPTAAAEGDVRRLRVSAQGMLWATNVLNASASALGDGHADAVLNIKDAGDNNLAMQLYAKGYVFNGTTWDRARSGSASGNGLGAANVAPVANTKNGATKHATESLAATVTAVKASAGNVYGLQVLNDQAATAYIQIFDVAAGSVTLGTTVPDMQVRVAANSFVDVALPTVGVEFGTAISIASTTTASGSTGSAAGVDVYAQYE